jgi:hypothetical protein
VRQIHNIYQSPVTFTVTNKTDKVKTFLALIDGLQVQDSFCSDYELNTPTISKNEILCKLAVVIPEI